ncbi:unnamed protein product [Urochloa humidicola]
MTHKVCQLRAPTTIIRFFRVELPLLPFLDLPSLFFPGSNHRRGRISLSTTGPHCCRPELLAVGRPPTSSSRTSSVVSFTSPHCPPPPPPPPALVKFVAVDGNIVQTDLIQEQASPEWLPMRHSWGAIWSSDTPMPLRGPFSIRLTNESGGTFVATDVIPENWHPNTIYNSNIQF